MISTDFHGPRAGARGRRTSAIVLAGALAAGPVLLGASAAHAAETPVAYARAELVGGTIGGADLRTVVAVQAAAALNNGSRHEVVSANPLAVEVLRSVNVPLPNGVALDLGSGVDAGAAMQWAGAWSDGSAEAHVKTVGNGGAADVHPSDANASGAMVIDLTALLGSRFTSTITSLDLRLGAVGASAGGHGEVASGDYTLAGAQLLVRTPAISNLTSKVLAAIEPAEARIASLGGSSGALASALRSSLGGVLGSNASVVNVDVSIDSNLRGAVEPLLTARLDTRGASVDLEQGAIVIDLQTLLGRNLNSLPPSTELLSEAILVPVLNSVTGSVADIADDVVDVVRATLKNVRVDIRASVNVLTPQQGETVETCVEVPIVNDLPIVGGLVGGLTGGLTGPLTELVCTVTTTVLPDLRTSLDLRIAGDLSMLGKADADVATATLTVLGVPVAVDISAVLRGISLPIINTIGNGESTVAAVQAALQAKLVDPATSGLLGGAGLGTALADVLSVKVNVKSTGSISAAEGTYFTQTAVRVAALQGSLVTLNLATATVGPGVLPTDDGEDPDGPGGPGGPGCTGDDCVAAPPPSFTDGGGPLAFTGANIGALIALIMVLIAAGVALLKARRGGFALGRDVLLG